MKPVYIIFVLVTLFSTAVKAQCSFTVTAGSAESRCRESGTITITPSTAGSYIYQIISGPETTAAGSSPIFTNLPSGNYVVRTTLAGCSINTNVTVAGNYTEPGLLVASGTKVACPNGTGCITAVQPTNGRNPYTYSIISGPVTRPLQPGPVFCGLPAGDYTIQSFDSCSIVRSTTVRVPMDTGDYTAYTYGYDLRHANCTDLIVCPTTGWTGTSSHSLMMVWYVTPSGDTLKVNGFEYPVRCDTLINQSHSYGTWQMLAYDSCGRIRKSTFSFSAPSLYISSLGPTCGGYQVQIGNQWKYGIPVGYSVYRCSDDSLIFQYDPTPPTGFYSPPITLSYDTCYYFVHYNSCGDTVRYMNYVNSSQPVFNINACDGPACSQNGEGTITVYQTYHSGVPPITYSILSGPEGVGTSVVQPPGSSWVNFPNMALGTYTIGAVDACGQRDTVVVVVDEPLIRTIEITQQKNCSGGANVHIKITSNFYNCQQHGPSGIGSSTYVTATSPAITPVNIVSTASTATSPSVWEADYLNVNSSTVLFRTFAAAGCNYDTTVSINRYFPPVLSTVRGSVCTASGTGTVSFNLTGGTSPFIYRVKSNAAAFWGPWQSTPVFNSVTAGMYEIEVRDSCPNGSIAAFSFNPWTRSSINVTPTCAAIGDTIVFRANPALAGVGYEWLFNGSVIATGSQLVIPNYQPSNTGIYRLRQVFPGGICVDSVDMVYFHCMVLPIQFGKLTGNQKNNIIQLNWNTLGESADSWFEIERSEDGSMFHTIAYLLSLNKPAGANYSFNDRNFTGSRQYYRIKYGANNSAGYSNVVSFVNDELDVKVTPVPFRNTLHVKLTSQSKTVYRVSLSDLSGKKVLSKNITANAGVNRYQWSDEKIASLPPGIYIIEFISENNIYRQKLVKE